MSGRALVGVLLAVVFAAGSVVSVARADGDPGSDVLVFQDLFAGADAGVSVQQQVQLGAMLKSAQHAGLPVRVAIIASPSDLGAVTALWRKPRAYARFLGFELSLAYKQRLLVVMPNGFGFNWPGHSTAPAYRLLAKIPIERGTSGLLTAAETAVGKLAAAAGIRIAVPTHGSGTPAPARGVQTSGGGSPATGRATDDRVAIIALALTVIAAVIVTIRRTLRRRRGPRRRAEGHERRRRRSPIERRWAVPGVVLVLGVAVAAPIAVLAILRTPSASQRAALAFNPYLDSGTPLSGVAPDFTLSDQFGQQVSLRSFRGKVVILAFNDSECTTICPLTTSAMLDAKAMLGRAGSRVQLLGIDANPASISLEDVWSYSELHGMLHAWHFLTGSLPQLKRVWQQYAVEAAVEHGQISHTPALFVIDPQGRKARLYITQMSYTAIGQLGQLLAHEASSLLPGHPRVRSDLSYSRAPVITPSQPTTLPRAGGGTVQLGPGRAARVFVFFATWDQETSGLAGPVGCAQRLRVSRRAFGLATVDGGR